MFDITLVYFALTRASSHFLSFGLEVNTIIVFGFSLKRKNQLTTPNAIQYS
ncbi:MAG: hypothetical protein ABIN89_20175 [Chitinophagaceae bacterium]